MEIHAASANTSERLNQLCTTYACTPSRGLSLQLRWVHIYIRASVNHGKASVRIPGERNEIGLRVECPFKPFISDATGEEITKAVQSWACGAVR